jgi:hypothetical protein
VGKLTGAENIAKGHEKIKTAKALKSSNRVSDAGAQAWNDTKKATLEKHAI